MRYLSVAVLAAVAVWFMPLSANAASTDANFGGIVDSVEINGVSSCIGPDCGLFTGHYYGTYSANPFGNAQFQGGIDLLKTGMSFDGACTYFDIGPACYGGPNGFTLLFNPANGPFNNFDYPAGDFSIFIDSSGNGNLTSNTTSISFTIAPIPEASTWAMTLIGFVGLGFLGVRKTQRSNRISLVTV